MATLRVRTASCLRKKIPNWKDLKTHLVPASAVGRDTIY